MEVPHLEQIQRGTLIANQWPADEINGFWLYSTLYLGARTHIWEEESIRREMTKQGVSIQEVSEVGSGDGSSKLDGSTRRSLSRLLKQHE